MFQYWLLQMPPIPLLPFQNLHHLLYQTAQMEVGYKSLDPDSQSKVNDLNCMSERSGQLRTKAQNLFIFPLFQGDQ